MSARKPYYAPQRSNWWLKNSFFRWYMVREATALFAAIYCMILMTGLYRLTQGESAWNDWLLSLSQPGYIVFHCLALAAALYHALTWFRLAPKIMVVRLGRWTLPEKAMQAGQWLGFVLCTAAVLLALVWTGG